MFDPSTPSSLLDLQKWFGKIISQPIQSNNRLLPSIAQDASSYISRSKTLTARERIEIYHQQYWWRLIDVMQENFPSVLRLFGYSDFNEKIAIPYLSHYPPTHYSLNQLGQDLSFFIENYYENPEDKNLVFAMAQLDFSINLSFTAPHYAPPYLRPEELINISLKLQPHIYLYQAEANYLNFREEFLKNSPEYYENEPFPSLVVAPIRAVIYRNLSNVISWKFLSLNAFSLLKLIQKGETISSACANLASADWEDDNEISLCFYEWSKLQFFCLGN